MGEIDCLLEVLSILPCIFKGSLTVLWNISSLFFLKKFDIPTMS